MSIHKAGSRVQLRKLSRALNTHTHTQGRTTTITSALHGPTLSLLDAPHYDAPLSTKIGAGRRTVAQIQTNELLSEKTTRLIQNGDVKYHDNWLVVLTESGFSHDFDFVQS